MLKELDNLHLQTYARYPITLVKGDGAELTDSTGKQYIDFVAGIAVCSLGHAPKVLLDAIQEQFSKLHHVSNLYYTEPQLRLARSLIEHSCFNRIFLCNSGAEANEGACKLARKYARSVLGTEEPVILTAINSFHGRTLAMITATGQEKYQKGFEPLMPGFAYVPFDDIKALESVVGEIERDGKKRIAALLMEPIQGEGGVLPGSVEYFQALRKFCDERRALLIFDEIQCGVGRTGRLWAYEQLGVEPDILTAAKGLGGGFPIGAILAKEFCSIFEPGEHGTTYGGNPVACAVAEKVLEIVANPDFLENVTRCGEVFRAEAEVLASKFPKVFSGVRGWGLLNGMIIKAETKLVAADLVNAGIAEGVLTVPAGPKVLRFVPPLVITEEQVRVGLGRLARGIEKLKP